MHFLSDAYRLRAALIAEHAEARAKAAANEPIKPTLTLALAPPPAVSPAPALHTLIARLMREIASPRPSAGMSPR